VGHLIEAQGVIATVDEIQIFVTKLTTANNQTVLCQMVSYPTGLLILYGEDSEELIWSSHLL
jgi:small conductance mechanosensitive channel